MTVLTRNELFIIPSFKILFDDDMMCLCFLFLKQIREKLLKRQMSLDKSEKAKKLREMRKFGKKVRIN